MNNLSQNIYIGVDGGASKTQVRIEDAAGNLLAEAQGGHACIRISVGESWCSILDTINKALGKINLSLNQHNYRFHACMGLSGVEVVACYENFINTPHPFITLLLESDSLTACVGAHAGNDGDIIIIGTGTVGVQHYENIVIKVGGWGFPHDDLGSGAWIGLTATSLTMQWHDGRLAKESSLFYAILQHFNNDFSSIVAWANNAKSTHFAELTPLVISHAQTEKDPIAIEILQQAAKHIDLIGATLTTRSPSNKVLPCALIGGIAPFIAPYLHQELKQRLVKPKFDPAQGAILMLRQHMYRNGLSE